MARRARRATATRTTSTRSSHARRLGPRTSASTARCASTSPRRARRCTSLEFATLQGQGRRLRPLPRRHRRAARRSTSSARTCACTRSSTEREATLYLDTSGEPLFKRGYRRDADDAPLRENLAAGLLALSGWTPGTPLLDPMCGSGTIVDRGGADRRRPRAGPRAARSASRSSRGSTARRGSASRRRARDRVRAAPDAPAIFASDVDRGASSSTPRATCARPASTASSHVERRDVLARAAPAPAGILIANPPYGVRLDDDATRSRRSIRSSATR